MKTFLALALMAALACGLVSCTDAGADPAEVVLSWTAPDPRDADGDSLCVQYEMRYTTGDSTTPIDDWTLVDPGLMPAPLPAGSLETYAVIGMQSDTRYFFRVRTADKKGLWSGWSNVALKYTTDTSPPTVIIDLR